MKGIGLDVVEIERFRTSLTRTPSMRERLFTAGELEYADRKADPVPSLAARFAAREAVMKALGLGLGAFGFHDVWVEVEESGQPRLHVTARGPGTGRRPRRHPLAPLDQPRRPGGRRHRRRRIGGDGSDDSSRQARRDRSGVATSG